MWLLLLGSRGKSRPPDQWVRWHEVRGGKMKWSHWGPWRGEGPRQEWRLGLQLIKVNLALVNWKTAGGPPGLCYLEGCCPHIPVAKTKGRGTVWSEAWQTRHVESSVQPIEWRLRGSLDTIAGVRAEGEVGVQPDVQDFREVTSSKIRTCGWSQDWWVSEEKELQSRTGFLGSNG